MPSLITSGSATFARVGTRQISRRAMSPKIVTSVFIEDLRVGSCDFVDPFSGFEKASIHETTLNITNRGSLLQIKDSVFQPQLKLHHARQIHLRTDASKI